MRNVAHHIQHSVKIGACLNGTKKLNLLNLKGCSHYMEVDEVNGSSKI